MLQCLTKRDLVVLVRMFQIFITILYDPGDKSALIPYGDNINIFLRLKLLFYFQIMYTLVRPLMKMCILLYLELSKDK
jgi:hypothetical protein